MHEAETEVRNVLIVGAGGHGKEVAAHVLDLQAEGSWIALCGFVDDRKPPGTRIGPAHVVASVDALGQFLAERGDTSFHYITAVGDNRVRRDVSYRLRDLGAANLRPWTLVHPRASVGTNVRIGIGTCLAPGSIVTTDVEIGQHAILNVNSSVSHDGHIADYVNINPGATICGTVSIGEGAYIGAGATVINGISIGSWTIVGAGAVVVDDLPPCVTAVGIPARVIRRHD